MIRQVRSKKKGIHALIQSRGELSMEQLEKYFPTISKRAIEYHLLNLMREKGSDVVMVTRHIDGQKVITYAYAPKYIQTKLPL